MSIFFRVAQWIMAFLPQLSDASKCMGHPLNTINFDPNLIFKCINNLKTKVSVGPDGFPTILFKNLARQ